MTLMDDLIRQSGKPVFPPARSAGHRRGYFPDGSVFSGDVHQGFGSLLNKRHYWRILLDRVESEAKWLDIALQRGEAAPWKFRADWLERFLCETDYALDGKPLPDHRKTPLVDPRRILLRLKSLAVKAKKALAEVEDQLQRPR